MYPQHKSRVVMIVDLRALKAVRRAHPLAGSGMLGGPGREVSLRFDLTSNHGGDMEIESRVVSRSPGESYEKAMVDC